MSGISSNTITRSGVGKSINAFRPPLINPFINSSLKWHVKAFGEGYSKSDLFDVSESDLVKEWKTINGTSGNAIQLIEAKQPLYIESSANGKPAIRFDKIDDFLEAIVNITGTKITAFFVGSRISVSGNTSNYTTYNTANSNDFQFTDSFVPGFEAGPGNILGAVRNGLKASTSNPGNNTPYVYTVKFDGTNNTVYLNGVASTPVASTGNFDINRVLLGVRFIGSTQANFANVDIQEIIIYDIDFNDADRIKMESEYLSVQWEDIT